MIQSFVNTFIKKRPELEQEFQIKKPQGYGYLVKRLIEILGAEHSSSFESPDPERITVIDQGDYQGTQVYIIGEQGYQPSTYWVIAVSYGSCSGCDTYEAIGGYGDEVTSEEAKEYADLMLHMVQNMKQITGYNLEEQEEVA